MNSTSPLPSSQFPPPKIDNNSTLLPSSQSPTPRVAIVHDWLVGGGAELVVEQLHKMYPDAPIYTSYAAKEWRERLDGKVKTGWLQYLGKVRKYIPMLRILWFTNLNLKGYDLVISSSGAEAKGVKVPKGTTHINYCHAPTHYYWSRYDEYMKNPGFGVFDPLARIGLWLLVKPLQKWDYKAAQRPGFLIANSTHIKSEIKKYYGRDSVVIHPPIYTDRFSKPKNRNQKRKGFLVAGRQTPYKRFDLAVVACTKLNFPLTVIGKGPDHNKLRDMAGSTVTFLGHAPAEVVEQEFARAEAFIFPGLDDFGITPVEAMASGTPVIAYKAGGALDYVEPGVTGEFFNDQKIESLAYALKSFDNSKFNNTLIRNKSQQFSANDFRTKFQDFVESLNPQTSR